MAELLTLQLISPWGTLLDVAPVSWVHAQLVDGVISIWPGHAPLLAETVQGPLSYADQSGEHGLFIEAGILTITSEAVTVLVGGGADVSPEIGPGRQIIGPAQGRLNRRLRV